MAALPKRESPRFFKITSRRVRVVVISKIRPWLSHWDTTVNQSRRCGGPTCLLCSWGLPAIYRYVCLVIDQNGIQGLVEMRSRHYGLMEVMRNQTRGELGSVLNIRKTGEASNSPVEITVSDQEQVIEQDIARLVEVLGLPARHVTEQNVDEIAASNQKLEEVHARMSAQFNMSDQSHS